MTKAEIVGAVQAKLGLSRKDSAEIVDNLFDIIKGRLADGESVKISGFGNFDIRRKNPRRGRNPQTGEQIIISARKVLTFKPSQVLRKALNEK
ncbi:MAG: integration host factor subunit alpha [Pseudomonadota bacterium]